MKKKVIVALLVAAMSVSVVACGNNSSASANTESVELSNTKRSGEFDLDLEKLVTEIPDYSKLELEIQSRYEVTDEAVNEYLTNVLVQFGADAYKENTERDVVEAGDYVKVDYTGYKDDEAFEGGAATDVLIDLDNNKQVGQDYGFIDGFSEGLKGAKVGDTIKCPVTFPENYGKEELNGQEVIFEFVIKAIYTTDSVTMDDMTDDDVAKIFGETEIKTKDELDKQIRSDLSNNLYSAQVNAAKEYLVENSKVEIPEDYFEARLNEYVESLEKDYATGTQTLKEMIESSGDGTTYEEYLDSWKENLTNQIKVELIFGRIAQIEEIELDEDGFNTYVSYIVSQSSGTFADEKAAFEYFGAGNVDEGEAYIKNQYLVNQAVDVVAANVTPKFVETLSE